MLSAGGMAAYGLMGSVSTCEHVRHNKSDIAHRGNNKVEALTGTNATWAVCLLQDGSMLAADLAFCLPAASILPIRSTHAICLQQPSTGIEHPWAGTYSAKRKCQLDYVIAPQPYAMMRTWGSHLHGVVVLPRRPARDELPQHNTKAVHVSRLSNILTAQHLHQHNIRYITPQHELSLRLPKHITDASKPNRSVC